MTTPAATDPPTEENLEAYRAAILAYRQAFKAEREKHGSFKMNPHFPKHVAAEAVLGVSPSWPMRQSPGPLKHIRDGSGGASRRSPVD